ncbi:MAG: polysaccharide pyruvyl transferase family protein [Acidobacteriales bacterium]|nr:polysaccharide pyruvyl transferase family protein [Terriglobales bacterium]
MPASPRFLLYGVSGVYNYGCEAIVRGTVAILRKVWPDAAISYASLMVEDDTWRLAGCDIKVVRRIPVLRRSQMRRYSARYILCKACSLLALDPPGAVERIEALKETDVVLSIGGDLYTPGRDGRGYPRELIEAGERIMGHKKKLIIWGASIGPFSKDPEAERIVTKHLRRATLITSRETSTTTYLAKLAVDSNVVEAADPAFAVPSIEATENRPHYPITIGINLSPLSILRAGAFASLDEAATSHGSTISRLIEHFNCDVVLLPHVVSTLTEKDDDVRYLYKVYSCLSTSARLRTSVNNVDCGFLGMKPVLRSCTVVIAARMHCAINASSEGVPTVLLAYSEKAHGMAHRIYPNPCPCLDLSRFTFDNCQIVLSEIIANSDNIRSGLRAQIPGIRRQAEFGGVALKRSLESANALTRRLKADQVT